MKRDVKILTVGIIIGVGIAAGFFILGILWDDNEKEFNDINIKLNLILNELGIETELELSKDIPIPLETLQEIEKLEKDRNELQQKLIERGKTVNIAISQLLKEGNVFYYANEFSKAIERYELVLSLNSDSFQALNNIGVTLINLNQPKEALTYFDLALKINSDYTYALNSKGAALALLNQYKEAIIYFDKVLDLDPNHIVALNNKGAALALLNQYKEAIIYFDKVLDLDPNHESALHNKESALIELETIQANLEHQ